MPRRRRRYAMAGRPRRSFRRSFASKRIPLLPVVVGLGTTIVPAVFGGGGYSGALPLAQAGDFAGAIREFMDVLSIQTTGYKPSDGSNWGLAKPAATWTAVGLSLLGHWAANKFGLNRSIAKIPFVGKYISI
ncbi:hypothetical protein MUP79_01460 [Candidatus Bathyarchaeota archaeon]|nr:hypothetical protein [Candidatus Bathyarchaeota archaeon]